MAVLLLLLPLLVAVVVAAVVLLLLLLLVAVLDHSNLNQQVPVRPPEHTTTFTSSRKIPISIGTLYTSSDWITTVMPLQESDKPS